MLISSVSYEVRIISTILFGRTRPPYAGLSNTYTFQLRKSLLDIPSRVLHACYSLKSLRELFSCPVGLMVLLCRILFEIEISHFRRAHVAISLVQ